MCMDESLVSIVVPVYNAEQYLCKCLDSILSQTYKTIEIICVNDGSEDSSLSILQGYHEKDQRIHLINIPNGGVSNARNVALQYSNGSMILFVDSDDWIDIDCVERLVHFSQVNSCDIVMFPYIRERKGTSLKRDLFKDSMVLKGDECKRLARRMIGPIGDEISSPVNLDSYGTVWGKLYHRSIVEGLEFEDLSIIGTAEDSLFNMFAFKRAKVVGYCNDIKYHYRRNNELSLTGGSIPGIKEKWHTAYGIIEANFQEDEEKLALSNRIALGALGLLIYAYKSNEPYKQIRSVLADEILQDSLKGFQTQYMSIVWKFFYFLVKHKMVLVLIVILSIIQFIRNH